MTGYDAAKSIVEQLRAAGFVALFAGGCVRDRLLGLDPVDYDVATDATPDDICRVFRRTKRVGAQFGVVLVRIKRIEVEVATFRTDGSYRDGRRPDTVEFATPEEDARRRDFTVNGMFWDPFADVVVDHVGGQKDLADRLIRCIGDADARFAEDHLRMLRAVRFAARLGFAIEPVTRSAIARNAPRIAAISAERIRMELEMILTHATREEGWRLIWEAQLANHLVHELAWTDTEADRCARTLAGLPQRISASLGLATLLIGQDRRLVRRACGALRCSTATSRATEYLVVTCARVFGDEALELADVKNMMASGLGDQALALSRAVAQADHAGENRVLDLGARATGVDPADYAPPPLVTGDDLVAMKLPPGPRFSAVLDTIYRAQLNEEFTDRDAALERARALVGQMKP